MARNTMDAFMEGRGLASLTSAGSLPSGGGGVEQRQFNGVTYEEVPVFEPAPWLRVSKDVAWGVNDRTVTFLNQTVNVEVSDRIGFDLPSVAYAITASVQNTAAATNPAAGFANYLDQFRIQFLMTGSNRTFQTSSVLGSTICGDAKWPRKMGRPCWRFGSGSTLLVRVVPLVANIRIDVVVYVIEETVGSNIVQVG